MWFLGLRATLYSLCFDDPDDMSANVCLILRADADTLIGTGHVMRCLALAQAWQDAGGRAIFIMAMGSPGVKERLNLEKMELVQVTVVPGSPEDAIQTAALAKQIGASWVVLDGYHFGAEYQRLIKNSGLRLRWISDNGQADHYYADIIVDQNINAHEGFYTRREPHTRLLLGTRFVLLRREFREWRGWERKIVGAAHKVLVTLGGSDPENGTLKVIQALPQLPLPDLEVTIVVGPSNPYLEQIRSEVECSTLNIQFLTSVTNMPALIASADMAIIAAGGTLWELLYMGCSIISYVNNPIQDSIVHELDKLAIVKYQGHLRPFDGSSLVSTLQEVALSHAWRKRMAVTGRLLVDGKGTERILEYLSA